MALGAPSARLWLLASVAVSPALIGIVLVERLEASRGARHLLARILRFRFPLRYYALALLMAPAASLAGQGLAVATGTAGGEDWLISPGSAFERADIVVLVAISLTEIGWRGVGLPAGVGALGSVVGALGVGLAQGLWSLEAVTLGADATGLGPVGLVVAAIAWSPMWAFLTHRTGGSLVACILFHASVLFWANVTPSEPAGQLLTLLMYSAAGAAALALLPPPRALAWRSRPRA